MSKKLEVKLNRAGVAELLKSAEVQNMLQHYAGTVQEAAGAEYETTVTHGKNRCWATISPSTPKAYYSNLKHNTLLKALGGVKG